MARAIAIVAGISDVEDPIDERQRATLVGGPHVILEARRLRCRAHQVRRVDGPARALGAIFGGTRMHLVRSDGVRTDSSRNVNRCETIGARLGIDDGRAQDAERAAIPAWNAVVLRRLATIFPPAPGAVGVVRRE